MSSIYILTNSPGEVSGWVKPVASALNKTNINAHVILVTLPCTYASGMEKIYGKELIGIDRAFSFAEVLKTATPDTKKNIVLQLGGDPMYGALLSLRLRGKWLIYTSRPRWRFFVDHFFLPDCTALSRFVKKKISPTKYTLLGNLMFDSVPECECDSEIRRKFSVEQKETVVSLLAGSRPFEYYEGFSYFISVAKKILSETDISQVFLPIAPTVDEKILHEGLMHYGIKWKGDIAEEVLWDGPGRIRFIRDNVFEAIKISKLAVAFPGTNNLQVASLGVPLLVVAPLNYAENIPLDGLPGLIPLSVPGAKKIKKKLVMWYNSRVKFVSLPNRISGENIVPENRYAMTPEMGANLAIELLQCPQKLAEIQDKYKLLSFERGAAEKLVAFIVDFLENK